MSKSDDYLNDSYLLLSENSQENAKAFLEQLRQKASIIKNANLIKAVSKVSDWSLDREDHLGY